MGCGAAATTSTLVGGGTQRRPLPALSSASNSGRPPTCDLQAAALLHPLGPQPSAAAAAGGRDACRRRHSGGRCKQAGAGQLLSRNGDALQHPRRAGAFSLTETRPSHLGRPLAEPERALLAWLRS